MVRVAEKVLSLSLVTEFNSRFIIMGCAGVSEPGTSEEFESCSSGML